MFKDFEFGDIYKNAHLAKIEQSNEHLESLLNWLTKSFGLLYFCGSVGAGKTYFAAAIRNELRDKKKAHRAYSEAFLLSELRKCISLGWDAGDRIEAICDTEFLIIDDLGSSSMTDWQKEVLFHLVDLRYTTNKPTLITSNLTYNKLKETFHERFASRVYGVKNTIICVNCEDRRQQIM